MTDQNEVERSKSATERLQALLDERGGALHGIADTVGAHSLSNPKLSDNLSDKVSEQWNRRVP